VPHLAPGLALANQPVATGAARLAQRLIEVEHIQDGSRWRTRWVPSTINGG